LKDKKTIVKKIEGCTLNDIMGYDFIQIKNIKQTPEEKPHVPEKEIITEETSQPALYATTGNDQHNDGLDYAPENNPEEEPDSNQKPPTVLNVTEDDMDEIADQEWEYDSLATADFEEQIHYYEHFLDDDLNDQPNDTPVEKNQEEIEREQALAGYSDEIYELLKACNLNEEDRKALNQIQSGEDITSDTAETTDENNKEE
jgi:hypothetical protein